MSSQLICQRSSVQPINMSKVHPLLRITALSEYAWALEVHDVRGCAAENFCRLPIFECLCLFGCLRESVGICTCVHMHGCTCTRTSCLTLTAVALLLFWGLTPPASKPSTLLPSLSLSYPIHNQHRRRCWTCCWTGALRHHLLKAFSSHPERSVPSTHIAAGAGLRQRQHGRCHDSVRGRHQHHGHLHPHGHRPATPPGLEDIQAQQPGHPSRCVFAHTWGAHTWCKPAAHHCLADQQDSWVISGKGTQPEDCAGQAQPIAQTQHKALTYYRTPAPEVMRGHEPHMMVQAHQ